MKKLLLLSLALLSMGTKSQSILANPNPFVNRTLLSYTLAVADTMSVDIADITGQTVIHLETAVARSAGAYQDSLIMDGFVPGIYYASIRTGAQTASCKLVKTAATGISVNQAEEIKIYPNPSAQKVRVRLGSLSPEAEVLLYDELGKLVYSTKANGSEFELDLNSFSHGLYSLKLADGSQEKIYRIIKE